MYEYLIRAIIRDILRKCLLLSRFRVINTLPKGKQDAHPGGYEGRKELTWKHCTSAESGTATAPISVGEP